MRLNWKAVLSLINRADIDRAETARSAAKDRQSRPAAELPTARDRAN